MLVVNTCAFIDSAKQESVDAILEMAQQKKDGACRRLIVTGCLAERYRDELRARDPGDRRGARHRRGPRTSSARSPGPIETPRTAPLTFFRDRRRTRRPSRQTPSPADLHLRRRHAAVSRDAEALRLRESRRGLRLQVRVLHHPDAARTLPQPAPPTRSFAKRGRWRPAASRSCCSSRRTPRSTASIAASAARWRGCSGALNEIDGLEWIRLLYLYPTTIDDATLDAMAECDKVCKYIDLPLQHASNPVLKRMKRPGTRQKYDRLLDQHPRTRAGVALRTTFIVGFPGETEADVDELCGFVSDHASTIWGLHLLARGRHDGVRPGRRRAGADEDGAAQPGHEPAEAPRQRTPETPRSGSGCGCSSMGRRPTTSWS